MFGCLKDSAPVATRLTPFIDIPRQLTGAFVSFRHIVPPKSWSNSSGQALRTLSVCLQTFQHTPGTVNCHIHNRQFFHNLWNRCEDVNSTLFCHVGFACTKSESC